MSASEPFATRERVWRGRRRAGRGVFRLLAPLDGAVPPTAGHRTVVLDVEPVLVHWAEPASLLSARLQRWCSPSLARVVVCTNSARFSVATNDCGAGGPAVALLTRARKPWTSKARLGVLAPALVVGDLMLLDGLLAWRLGADLALVENAGNAPWWPRFLALFNLPLKLLLTKRVLGARTPKREQS